MTGKEINNIDLAKYEDKSKKGLILEVDLEYFKSLHDIHDYPLPRAKIKVNKGMLSEYCETIRQKYNISVGQVVKKLIPTQTKKNMFSYRNLQLYLDLGLKLEKVHRVLKFDQLHWLKQYIDFNTQKRTSAQNSFEKDFLRL